MTSKVTVEPVVGRFGDRGVSIKANLPANPTSEEVQASNDLMALHTFVAVGRDPPPELLERIKARQKKDAPSGG